MLALEISPNQSDQARVRWFLVLSVVIGLGERIQMQTCKVFGTLSLDGTIYFALVTN